MPTYKVTTGDNQLLDFDMTDSGGGVFIPAKADVELQARVGATNEIAAATDTATSGLNGLIKRLLGRVSTIISLIPDSLLQNTIRTSSFKGFSSNSSTNTVTTTISILGADFDVRNFNRASFAFENLSGSALNNIQLYYRRGTVFVLQDQGTTGSYNAANTGIGANNPLIRVIAASTNPHTIGAGQNSWIDINCSGLSGIAIYATVASGSASVRTSWVFN